MKKILMSLWVMSMFVLMSVSVSAHIHPLVPFMCAPLDTGAGNEALPQNKDNGQQFLPGLIPIDADFPGKAKDSNGAISNVFAGNPGKGTAEGNCADPQD